MCLNSLADDKLTASVRCLAPNGHLLEIGKYDILKGTALSMRPMHDNITFHGINLDSLFKGAQKDAVSFRFALAPRKLRSLQGSALQWTGALNPSTGSGRDCAHSGAALDGFR